jgi:RNA polymerase sigma factor (sigma-70 family)
VGKSVKMTEKALQKPLSVEEHLPLVKNIAKKVLTKYYYPATLNFDDLISWGTLGLIAAIDHYDPNNDPNKNTKFSTFAYMHVYGAILDGIREWHRMFGYRSHDARKRSQEKRQRVEYDEINYYVDTPDPTIKLDSLSIWNNVSKLPTSDASIIYMKYAKNMTYREIAKYVGRSHTWVMVNHDHSIEKLRGMER